MKFKSIHALGIFLLWQCTACSPFKSITRNVDEASIFSSNFESIASFEGMWELVNTYETMNVLIIHGIGPTKDFDYAEKQLIPQVVESFKPKIEFNKKDSLIINPTSNSTISINEFKGTLNGESKTLRFFSIHWACVTEQIKEQLNQDDSLVQYVRQIQQNKPKVHFSEIIKRFLINESFSEAFAYGSPSIKDSIKLPVKKAIELMALKDPINSFELFGKMPEESYFADKSNLIPEVGDLNDPEKYGFVSLTRSFGGKIIFDVVINDQMEINGEAAKRYCGYTHQFFMLCNQISLLNLQDNTLIERINTFADRHQELCGKPIRMIAFNDAMDILSFKLPEALSNDHPMEVINVWVNNTTDYLEVKNWAKRFVLNKVALPDSSFTFLNSLDYELVNLIGAHENYPNNALIHYLISNGYNGKEGVVDFQKELEGFEFISRKGQIDIVQVLKGSTSNKCN